MYTNVVQHYDCQSQDNFSTLNITLILNQINIAVNEENFGAK